MDEKILEWVAQLGIPGFTLAGIIYLVKIYITKPKEITSTFAEEILRELLAENKKLFDKHNDSITRLTIAVDQLSKTTDLLIRKDVINRTHWLENALSDLCRRTNNIEKRLLGDKTTPIVLGPATYKHYVKGRESGCI